MATPEKPHELRAAEAEYERHQQEYRRITQDVAATFKHVGVQLPAFRGGPGSRILRVSSIDTPRAELERALGQWLEEQADALPMGAGGPHRKAANKRFTKQTNPDPLERSDERDQWVKDAALAEILDPISRGTGGALSRRLSGMLRITPEFVGAVRDREEPSYLDVDADRPRDPWAWRRQREEQLATVSDEDLRTLVRVAQKHQQALDAALEAEYNEARDAWYSEWSRIDDELATHVWKARRAWDDARFGLDDPISAPDRSAPPLSPAAEATAWREAEDRFMGALGDAAVRRDAALRRQGTDRAGADAMDPALVERIDAAARAAGFPPSSPFETTTAPNPAIPVQGPIQAWLAEYVTERPGLRGADGPEVNRAIADALNAARTGVPELADMEPLTSSDVHFARSGALDAAVAAEHAPGSTLIDQASHEAMQGIAERVIAHARVAAGLSVGAGKHNTLVTYTRRVAVEQFGVALTNGETTTFIPDETRVPVRLALDPTTLDGIVAAAFDASSDAGHTWATPATLGIADRTSVWQEAFARLGFAPEPSPANLVVMTNTGVER